MPELRCTGRKPEWYRPVRRVLRLVHTIAVTRFPVPHPLPFPSPALSLRLITLRSPRTNEGPTNRIPCYPWTIYPTYGAGWHYA
ncbi:hypothetical protein FA13DRAFT_1748001 [Coprinellus micaceus]|uniref:Uncharacterized protein n=1 Tax=Coprinellus micaceus TaxID=71717 RepID=A0A4Y7RZD7_COPMI|nr:hypothetical protein FA13DRAFT_1748001 [Coprinellus micaceus]